MQVILGLIKRENLIVVSASRSRKMGQFPFLLYPASSFKRPFDLYWWAELNFGQKPVFLEASVFKLYPPLMHRVRKAN